VVGENVVGETPTTAMANVFDEKYKKKGIEMNSIPFYI